MIKNRILSFKYAFNGIYTALKDEPNLKFHFLAGLIAIFFSWYFEITKIEWISVFILIGLVITVELTNTAIEEVVNSFTDKTHPAAKTAKDVSAGAVLVVALTALIVGLLIFLPHIFAYIAKMS